MPLLIFGPLLLFVEKKILKLLKYTLIFLTPYLLEVLVYNKSLYFKETVLKMKPIKQKFFEPLFSMHSPSIHVILLLVVGVCALSFWLQKNRDEVGFKRWSIYIPFLSLASFFLFVNWEPAWFLILTPFLVLNVLFNKQSTFLILIEIALYYFFIAAVTGNFTKNADQELFIYGIFNANTDLVMKSLFYPRIASWNYTMVTSCLLVLSVYKFPFEEFLSKSYFKFQVPNKNLMRIRFQLGVLIFLMPGLLTLNSGKYLWIFFSLLFFPVLQWILIFFFLKRSGNEIQNLFTVDV